MRTENLELKLILPFKHGCSWRKARTTDRQAAAVAILFY